MQDILTLGDVPSEAPFTEEDKKLILHTYLMISGNRVMFSDAYPVNPATIGNNVSLTVLSSNVDEMKAQFNQLKEGGKVEMDLQETFWSKCYGVVIDKFGINWQFNYVNKKTLAVFYFSLLYNSFIGHLRCIEDNMKFIGSSETKLLLAKKSPGLFSNLLKTIKI